MSSRRASAATLLVAVLLALAGCSTPAPAGGDAVGTPDATVSVPAAPASPTVSGSASDSRPSIQPVAAGELTRFRVERNGAPLLDASSSGLARYETSASCEVPGQPCYDAPTFDQVARIDVGAPPSVPGTETTFITGHSNRYHPDDPGKGVFTRLQDVRAGDTLVLTTTQGVFVYAVSEVLTVPFDRLTSTPDVVDVRPNTVVAISCVVAPGRASYLGNYVVVGTLRSSTPA